MSVSEQVKAGLAKFRWAAFFKLIRMDFSINRKKKNF